MRKTASEVETDIYKFLKDDLQKIIKGKVYRSGTRPLNSEQEDAVITFVTGLDGQTQSGAVNVNVYVPKLRVSNQHQLKDNIRCDLIEKELHKIIQKSKTSLKNYLLKLNHTIQTFEDEDIKQYFVNAKIKFKYNTYNN